MNCLTLYTVVYIVVYMMNMPGKYCSFVNNKLCWSIPATNYHTIIAHFAFPIKANRNFDIFLKLGKRWLGPFWNEVSPTGPKKRNLGIIDKSRAF